MRIDTIGPLDHVLGPARCQQIGLLDEVEILVFAPVGIAKPVVADLWLGHRLGLLAHHALQAGLPKFGIAADQLALRLGKLLGLLQPLLGNLTQNPGRLADFLDTTIGPAPSKMIAPSTLPQPCHLVRIS